MPHTLTPDAADTLDQLEKYYIDKLAALRSKRAGPEKPSRKQEIVTVEPMRVVIDPGRKQLTLSWK